MSDEAMDQESKENSEQEPELDRQGENQDTGTEAEVPDDVDALKALLAKREHDVKKLYARLKQQEAKPEAKTQPNSQPDGDSDWKKKIEFITTKGRDLAVEDIDEVIAYARGKGISYEQAIEAPVIKSYLSDKQSKERVARATPSPSSSSTTVNGKTWSKMTDKERAENFDKVRDNLTKRA